MKVTIRPSPRLSGRVQLPGDKSVSHRLAMLGAIAEGVTRIANFATSHDCHSTLACLSLMSVPIAVESNHQVTIQGRGLLGLKPSSETLDAQNSGSTIRMLSGILAGQKFATRISGDESLQKRPMNRIMAPLTQMGAHIEAIQGNYPPLTIHGGRLRPICYELPVASAQVKSAVLLAGLYAEGETTVVEPVLTRNHTELALRGFGAEVKADRNTVSVRGGQKLRGIETTVPGDLSSAAFFIGAATLAAGSEVILEEVGLNPGRRGIVDLLAGMGASIEILDTRLHGGEPVADLRVRTAGLRGGRIFGAQIPQVIDEIPILAVMATQSEEGIEIRDAGELRVKESDRIRSIVENLRAMGADVEEFEDGLAVAGRQRLQGTVIKTYNDHRIAMAFAVAGLVARGDTVIEGAECAAVSFPGFFEALEKLKG
ncbi:MAG: 3-phosphoshikimate 1-carboxyvinyltransferase [Acidobacteria bacterium]|nr:3-phosphoshikimate 1-carboxyvinyltransferase [Acidobacteriota bacterium]MCI0624784.1 3-phosphoshikimate 1-carboxyvinyltransferase [Acidobacteriota bacterium]MCI0719071.1 3-phosphoshikimate 1-carboxyvinyltransferase [Acidobacteriota bacterium]